MPNTSKHEPTRKTKYINAFILSCIVSALTFTVIPIWMGHKSAPIMAVITNVNFLLLFYRTDITNKTVNGYVPIIFLVNVLCTVAVAERFHFLLYFAYIIMTVVFIAELRADIKNIQELKREEDDNALLD